MEQYRKKIEGDAEQGTLADLPQTLPVVKYTRTVSPYPEAHIYSAVGHPDTDEYPAIRHESGRHPQRHFHQARPTPLGDRRGCVLPLGASAQGNGLDD